MESVITSLLGSNPTLAGAAIIVILLVVAGLISGQITPKWITKSLLDARDDRVAQANLRAEDYKKLWEVANAALEVVRAQNSELLVTAQTTRKIVEAIPVPVPNTEGGA